MPWTEHLGKVEEPETKKGLIRNRRVGIYRTHNEERDLGKFDAPPGRLMTRGTELE